jgi:glycosyltransferase involved in cell wall biosynthesis
MKLIFISTVLCHHQVHFSDELYKQLGDDFHFIACRKPLDWRVDLKMEGFERPYLLTLSDHNDDEKIREVFSQADAVIWGSANLRIIKRINKKALIFRYSERIDKIELNKRPLLERAIQEFSLKNTKRFLRKRDSFLLSAGYYSSFDFKKRNMPFKAAYEWGYFPVFRENDKSAIDELKKSNSKVQIVWSSRMIDWKHPETMIAVAKGLLANGISNFIITMAGNGAEKANLEKAIASDNLGSYFELPGDLPAPDMRSLLDKANIAILTSDRQEGWGVGVNEAMNSRCATIACKEMGSVPYLIKHGKNGFSYDFGHDDDLVKEVVELVNDEAVREKLGDEAYISISGWKPSIAAERFVAVAKALLQKEKEPSFDDGPMSKLDY